MNEYKDALNELFVYSKHIANKVEILSLTECYEKLEQLINEHFDNSLLKFEELKEGMWVWDNFRKRYCKIFKVKEWEPKPYLIVCEYGFCDFEENRFYRYEV